MNNSYKRLKYACYTICLSMSVVANLPPILFLTFRNLYGVSYSFLGMLILINYVTQLGIDLILSFFSSSFNISKTVKSMPYLTFLGLAVYSLYPLIFPETAYIGLLIGTIIFSFSAGLAEVLISPIIASIPSKEPDREMSKLHSIYAWGVVPVILITTICLLTFGNKNWHLIVFIYMIIPVLSMLLFYGVKIPDISSNEKVSGVFEFLKNKTVWLYVAAIFCGGAAECTMSQWSSSYLEKALSIPKVWGDVFGVSLFAVMLGIGRTLYAKYGKNIMNILIWGSFGAAICYLVSALSPYPLVGLISCALTGFFTAMLWPGSLVVASEKFPHGGVMIYALMAAGGDFGAALVPQLIGIVTDTSIHNSFINSVSQVINLTPEQIGMKLGIFLAMLFPVAGVYAFLKIKKQRKLIES